MADSSVFIEGAADGAFATALEGLPPWATQSTLYKIQGVLEKSLGIQSKLLSSLTKAGGTTSAMSPSQLKDVNDELVKMAKELKAKNADDARDKKRRKEKDEAEKKSIFSINKLKTSGEKLTYVLTGLAAIGAKVLEAETQYIKTNDALFQSGINVLNGNNSTVDGFKALNQMVNLTGMRLETLQKTLVKYNTSINAVGITKFTKSLASAIPSLTKLGFNSDEAAELMGSYVDSQQGFTDMRRRTETEISQQTVAFADRLNKMSLALGMSRENLLTNMKTASQSTEINMVNAVHGEEAARRVTEFTSGFSDASANMLREMAASIDPVHTTAYKNLVEAGLGDLAQKLGEIAIRSRTEDAGALRQEAQQLTDYIGKRVADTNAIWSAGQAGAKEAATTLISFRQELVKLSEATTGQIKGAVDTKSASSGLQTEMEKTTAAVQAAFSPMVTQINAAASALGLFNKALYGGINAVESETRSWIGLGLIVAGLGAGLAKLVSLTGRFASLFGGGAATAGGAGAASGGATAAGGAGAAAGGSIAAAAAGLVAMPLAIGAAGAYFQNEMASPEGRKRRIEQQKKILEEKKQILAGYKEQGATGKAVKKVEDEIAAHEKLITDLSVDRAKVQSQIPETKTPERSTVASPSAADDEKVPTPINSPSTGTTPVSAPVKSTSSVNSDINTQMAFQSSVLEQILQSTTNLVSVNKEILKYTRIAS
jgi:hypothetical protein